MEDELSGLPFSSSRNKVVIKTEHGQITCLNGAENVTEGLPEWGDFSEENEEEDDIGLSIEDPLAETSTADESPVASPRILGRLATVKSETALFSSVRNRQYDESEYQDEIDEIEGIINEDTESQAIVKEERVVSFEDVCDDGHDDQDSGELWANNVDQDDAPKKPVPKLKKLRTAICKICNTGFPTTDLYEHHMTTVHKDDRPYACRHCKKRFEKLIQMKKHETIHDPNRFKGPPQFACDMCEKRYHLKVSLEGHRKKVHLGYKPPQRNTNLPVVQHHSKSGVKNPKPYRKPLEIFPCTHCDLKFNWKSSLNKHMLCHTREKPFPCPICQQPFPRQTLVKTHIRKVHETPGTPSGFARPRPKWQTGQPCPCDFCDKVFEIPSRLRQHMRRHTGEKPFECLECGERFSIKGSLHKHAIIHAPPDTTGMRTYKCRVCGKDDLKRFGDLRSHRLRYHPQIPYDQEKDKAFACGVCGKPHFLRINAAICAILAHEPTYMQSKMFRHKCPECSPETFGFHNLTFLRRHWQSVHGDKSMPVTIRTGMYCENLKGDALPSLYMNKVKAQNIRVSGIPPEIQCQENGSPLFVDLGLFPMPEEERLKKKRTKGEKDSSSETPLCQICDIQFATHANLRRHMRVVHDPTRVRVADAFKCNVCDQRFRKLKTLRIHEKTHLNGKLVAKRRAGRPRKASSVQTGENTLPDLADVVIKEEPADVEEDDNEREEIPVSSMFRCRFCQRKFINIRALRMHELKAHLKPRSILNHQQVSEVTIEENPVIIKTESYPSTETFMQFDKCDEDCSDDATIKKFKCKFCRRQLINLRALRIHELRAHIKPWTTSSKNKIQEASSTMLPHILPSTTGKSSNATVNINDSLAIKRLVNFQTVHVTLKRLNLEH